MNEGYLQLLTHFETHTSSQIDDEFDQEFQWLFADGGWPQPRSRGAANDSTSTVRSPRRERTDSPASSAATRANGGLSGDELTPHALRASAAQYIDVRSIAGRASLSSVEGAQTTAVTTSRPATAGRFDTKSPPPTRRPGRVPLFYRTAVGRKRPEPDSDDLMLESNGTVISNGTEDDGEGDRPIKRVASSSRQNAASRRSRKEREAQASDEAMSDDVAEQAGERIKTKQAGDAKRGERVVAAIDVAPFDQSELFYGTRDDPITVDEFVLLQQRLATLGVRIDRLQEYGTKDLMAVPLQIVSVTAQV
jgi:hypothetical protein